VTGTSIRLKQVIRGHALEITRMIEMEETVPLAAEDLRFPPVVRRNARGECAVVDGMHRLADLETAAPGEKQPVLLVEGPDRWWDGIDADCEIGSGNCPTLDAIYASAGLLS
jgi:hypothetical protein